MKGRGCVEHNRNIYFTHILLYFANSLRITLTFLGDHCGVGLQLIEETRWQFSWKGPLVLVASTVNCLSTNYVLSLAILITSNFSFSRLFAFI